MKNPFRSTCPQLSVVVAMGTRALCVGALCLGLTAGCSGTIGDPIGERSNGVGGGSAGGGNGSGSGSGSNGGGMCSLNTLGTAPVRRLSHPEYSRTVADLFPGITVPQQTFAADLRVHGFENNAEAMNPSPVLIEQYNSAAEEIGQLVAASADKLLPCKPSGNTDMACAKQAIADLGKRAFRRPLTAAESARYEAFFAKQMSAISWSAAFELTTTAFLESPQFLYRLEFGAPADASSSAGEVPLDDYEMASRLSYFFWQSMPDAELFDAADAGSLHTQAEIEAQARRLLADSRAQIAIADFHRQWLDFDRLLTQNKDSVLFPEWNDAMRNGMREESTRFVEDVFGSGSGTLSELLTSTSTFVNVDIAKVYGVSAKGAAFEKIDLPGDQRSGILTQGTFLASRAHSTNGSPPLRGVAVLDALLCDRPPPPPPTANTAAPTSDPTKPKTNRQLFEERTSPSVCQGCHKQINGIGYGFEAFDSIGRYRTMDNGMPVDASGELIGTDVDGKYDGAVDLSHKLASSKKVEACAVLNMYRYAHGRDASADEACKLDSLDTALEKAGGDLRELMVRIATSNEFMHRPK